MKASLPPHFNYFLNSWWIQIHFHSILLKEKKRNNFVSRLLCFASTKERESVKVFLKILSLSCSVCVRTRAWPCSRFNWGKYLAVLFWGSVRKPQSFGWSKTWVFGNINLLNLKISNTSLLAVHSTHLLSASHKDTPSCKVKAQKFMIRSVPTS